MFLRIIVVATWIAITAAFYLAVALACRGLRPYPLAVAAYLTVRRSVDQQHRWLWYVLLWFSTVAVASAALWLGIQLAGLGEIWRIAVAATTCLAMGYAVFLFRPRPTGATRLRETLIAAGAMLAALGVGIGYLVALVRAPNWLVLDIGTYALAVPPLVWCRTLKARTAVCLLSAGAVYDAIHVFGTDWMDAFMDGIRDTPGVLRLPEAFALDAMHFFTIGHGDVLAPGMLAVVAARTSDRRRAAWLTAGTLVGAAAGHALAVAITMAIHHPLPALIVLVPATCLGYGAALLALRLRPEMKPLPATVVIQGAE